MSLTFEPRSRAILSAPRVSAGPVNDCHRCAANGSALPPRNVQLHQGTTLMAFRMNRSLVRMLLLSVVVGAFLFHSPHLHAEYRVNASELRLMPPLCKRLSIKNFTPDAKKYHDSSRRLPNHAQHWCHGYKYQVRASRAPSKGKRDRLLGRAIKEFSYLERHAKPTNPVLPDSHYRRGKILMQLDRPGDALTQFHIAIRLKPKYAAPYAGIADVYIDQNNYAEARNYVERGLKVSPKSKALRRRAEKLKRLTEGSSSKQ